MTSLDAHATSIRNVPDALLLDFGGVVFQTTKVPDGRRRLAEAIGARLARAVLPVDVDALHDSVNAGLTALKHWKHAQSRRRAPLELAPREIVGDFLASDLPASARALLIAEASDVLLDVTTILSEHHLRPGIMRLLDLADAHGIPVGIVSNAHSGRSHRQVLAAHGLQDRFAVQCYSDEVGLRKPHPGIIHLAAAALGTTADRSWYVGDTQDRDVVAGRRAGVGAVLLTRSQHTDSPPFLVAERADATFDTPEGLADALGAAILAGERPRPRPATGDGTGGSRPALLIDHGGVISDSQDDPAAMREFAAWLAGLLRDTDADAVLDLVACARAVHRAWKAEAVERFAAGSGSLPEVDPVVFWRDWFGASLDARQQAVLAAEAHDIMARFGRAKSRRVLRLGVRDLLESCRDQRMPVVVVSNTISGRAVRAECADHGLGHLIGAYVCSDEVGVRKPDVTIVREALRIADADPWRSWFLGDKPQNDAAAALAAGIAHRVLVRGGSTDDADLDAAVATGLATAVVDTPGDLLALLQLASPALVP
ncbi:HAD-IA family hydrolase [Cellulomonas cellasea]|uniref:HAD-IA family hydrolase n=1 Tax=Cellulomonas cellasea TaxID=43670 RepID=UPI0025A427C9|nr:HAD-IA family hydrolase [Cellulomonas cellasea]MDM8084228.1 HAD-IA family hydrolase [Cellulomonas cellasea]